MKLYDGSGDYERVDPNMISMIDICFMIIIFFIANMRLFLPEGDFYIKMPSAAPQEGTPSNADSPVVRVRLHADRSGGLAGIQVGERKVESLKELRRQIREISAIDRGPAGTPSQTEVEIDCDYNLSFESAVDALTAISGYVADDRTIVHTIERVRFSPPRKPKS
jgi:biopolymer transport protein ExbD